MTRSTLPSLRSSWKQLLTWIASLTSISSAPPMMLTFRSAHTFRHRPTLPPFPSASTL